MSLSNIRRLMTVLLLFVMSLGALAQSEIIRVTGKVVDSKKGEPLGFVNVTDMETKRLVAQTNVDGRFSVNVHANTTLRFSMIGAEVMSVKLRGRDSLMVQMIMTDVALGTVETVAKRVVNRVIVEPTPMEIVGNTVYFKNVVGVPSKMFGHNRRLVAQRVFKNKTRKQTVIMRPLVYDAVEYNQTQDRLYSFDMKGKNGDPLAPFVLIKNDTLRDKKVDHRDSFMYMDSLYVKNPDDDFQAVTLLAIEDYNRIVFRDTLVTSKGKINPMRWLDYSFGASEITDEALYPKAIPQLRDSRGNIDLRFPIGKAAFDPEEAHNAAEISKLKAQIQDIAATRDATVQALSINGTSSPDGRYASNLALARRRMEYAISYFRSQMPEKLRSGMKFSSNASVAPWSEVAKLLRADSLEEEADKVEAVMKLYKGDVVSQKMKRLPFYSKLLLNKYLPMLRSVGYTMSYSIYRNLTLDEIKDLYKKDYRKLSDYEFFKLYRSEENDAQREKYLRQALEVSPSFMIAANDLAALLIKHNKPDADVLRKFAGEKAPEVVNRNQMVALLANHEYQAADSLAAYVPATAENRLLLAVSGAFMGDYEANYDAIAPTGLRNEVVLLLAMKKNDVALEKSKMLTDDDAVTHYIKAICLHRSNDTNIAAEANRELKKALELDPELIEIAEGDADLNELDCIKEMKNKKEALKK
uniref:carboxypeptidase-like regulatory domain-containing protein n=1 Tax=Alloprevotella sp. TaxID=1872471 RepID=UPI003FEEB9A5